MQGLDYQKTHEFLRNKSDQNSSQQTCSEKKEINNFEQKIETTTKGHHPPLTQQQPSVDPELEC